MKKLLLFSKLFHREGKMQLHPGKGVNLQPILQKTTCASRSFHMKVSVDIMDCSIILVSAPCPNIACFNNDTKE